MRIGDVRLLSWGALFVLEGEEMVESKVLREALDWRFGKRSQVAFSRLVTRLQKAGLIEGIRVRSEVTGGVPIWYALTAEGRLLLDNIRGTCAQMMTPVQVNKEG